ncbi:MAG: HTTM domain-containing protein, partial [Candidatus Omnitrophota bacterium]
MLKRLFEPVDIAWLVFFRIAFGVIMLWESLLYIGQDKIKHLYHTPVFFFTYFGFEWVKPWPGLGMTIHFYVMAALSLCILFGLWYRTSAILFFLAFTYQFLLDQSNYLNHFYLISLISFLMIFLPANCAFSLDVLKNPEIKSETTPAWTLWLLRLQLAIPYFYGGLAKFNIDWLHGWPMKTWLPPMNYLPVIGPWLSEEWVAIFFSYSGVFLDLLIVPALLWKRTRVLAYLAACAFHLLNALIWHIGIFPWFMIPATLIFFSPSFPRHMLNWLGWRAAEVSSAQSLGGDQQKGKQLTLTLLVFYAAFQILYPFRHFLYPGNTDWTEEGHMFSWRMKLRDKQPHAIQFTAKDPQSGKTWNVNPVDLLVQRQIYKMSMNPDM